MCAVPPQTMDTAEKWGHSQNNCLKFSPAFNLPLIADTQNEKHLFRYYIKGVRTYVRTSVTLGVAS